MKEENPVNFYLAQDFEQIHLKRKNMTQAQLARALGYKTSQVNAIIKGKIEPSWQFMRKLCFITRMDLGDLITTHFNKIYSGRINAKRNTSHRREKTNSPNYNT